MLSVYDRTGMWGYLLGGWKDFSLEDGCGFNKLLAQFRATPKRHGVRRAQPLLVVVMHDKGERSWDGHTKKDEGLGGLAGAAVAEGRGTGLRDKTRSTEMGIKNRS